VQRFVTVVIDLTPVRDRTGPVRLLDIAEGRSKQVFTTWLAAQTPAFRAGIEPVAMDGFTGFKTAAEPSPTQPPSWTPSTSWRWPVTPSTAAGNGSSNNCTATAAIPVTRLRHPPRPAHRRRTSHRPPTRRPRRRVR
jgi:hypothetical protein